MKSDTQWVIDAMNVKTPSHKQHRPLSGGNQKVVIGRWLLTSNLKSSCQMSRQEGLTLVLNMKFIN